MQSYVEGFSEDLRRAVEIAKSINWSANEKTFNKVVVSGLGGSGIGGTIVAELLSSELSIPVLTNKTYSTPNYLDNETLFVACSYSGNTEETLASLTEAENKGAEICCITSGGTLAERALSAGHNHVFIPGGMPPRAAFAFPVVLLCKVMAHYGVSGETVLNQFEESAGFLDREEQATIQRAKELAKIMHNTIPVLYTDASHEGLAIRFRQQINENSKMLCSHHVYPEMNHNELVGWTKKDEGISVIFMRYKDDHPSVAKRMDITSEIYKQYTSKVESIWAKGENNLQRALYLVHIGDWISVILADMKGIDPVEVDVITHLKGELAKFNAES